MVFFPLQISRLRSGFLSRQIRKVSKSPGMTRLPPFSPRCCKSHCTVSWKCRKHSYMGFAPHSGESPVLCVQALLCSTSLWQYLRNPTVPEESQSNYHERCQKKQFNLFLFRSVISCFLLSFLRWLQYSPVSFNGHFSNPGDI